MATLSCDSACSVADAAADCSLARVVAHGPIYPCWVTSYTSDRRNIEGIDLLNSVHPVLWWQVGNM